MELTDRTVAPAGDELGGGDAREAFAPGLEPGATCVRGMPSGSSDFSELARVGTASGCEYIKPALRTSAAPTQNCGVMGAPNHAHETTAQMRMERELAKPLIRLSAYFTTMATTRPPSAWLMTTLLERK